MVVIKMRKRGDAPRSHELHQAPTMGAALKLIKNYEKRIKAKELYVVSLTIVAKPKKKRA